MVSERGHDTLEKQKLDAEEAVSLGPCINYTESIQSPEPNLVKVGLCDLISFYQALPHLLKVQVPQHHHTGDQASSIQALGANFLQTIAVSSLCQGQGWGGTQSHPGECTEKMQLIGSL